MSASSPSSAGAPLVVWAVSDGRAGIEAQVVGLADAIARKRDVQVVVKRIARGDDGRNELGAVGTQGRVRRT